MSFGKNKNYFYLTINDTSKSNSRNYEICRKMPSNYKCISS